MLNKKLKYKKKGKRYFAPRKFKLGLFGDTVHCIKKMKKEGKYYYTPKKFKWRIVGNTFHGITRIKNGRAVHCYTNILEFLPFYAGMMYCTAYSKYKKW